MQGNQIKTFILAILLGSFLFADTNKKLPIWPITNCKPLSTHWSIWKEQVICLQKNNLLVHYNLKDANNKKTRMHEFNNKPDIIKHFPLKRGDFITTISNKSSKMEFLAFDQYHQRQYKKVFDLDFQVSKADVRISRNGKIKVLLYYKKNQNYFISLWQEDEDLINVMVSAQPVEKFFYNERKSEIHFLKELKNKKVWYIYKNNKYEELYLPDFIYKPFFFWKKGKVYLIGIDYSGNIIRYAYINRSIERKRIFKQRDLVLADEVILLNWKGKLTMIVPIAQKNKLYIVHFKNFEDVKLLKKPQVKTIFYAAKIHPMYSGNQLKLLLQTKLDQVYLDYWNNNNDRLVSFDWRIDLRSRPNALQFSWQVKTNQKLQYQYVLDRKDDTIPLSNGVSINDNAIRFPEPEDGKYVLHIQPQSLTGKKVGPLYHIPVYWQYIPDKPLPIILNRVSAIHIASSKIQYVLRNFDNFDYFAEVNQLPVHDPRKKVVPQDGVFSIDQSLKADKYYLHIKARDKRSRNFSSTTSIRFFIWPYVQNNDCNTNIYSKVNLLLYEKNRTTDLVKQKEILLKMKSLYALFQKCKEKQKW